MCVKIQSDHSVVQGKKNKRSSPHSQKYQNEDRSPEDHTRMSLVRVACLPGPSSRSLCAWSMAVPPHLSLWLLIFGPPYQLIRYHSSPPVPSPRSPAATFAYTPTDQGWADDTNPRFRPLNKTTTPRICKIIENAETKGGDKIEATILPATY